MTAPVLTGMNLLADGVAWVEAQDKLPKSKRNWDQGSWRRGPDEAPNRCGTVGCLFGYIAERAGGQWASDNPASYHYDDLIPLNDDEPWDFENLDPDDRGTQGECFVGVFQRVQRLLGIDSGEASALASAGISAGTIRDLAIQIADARGYDLRQAIAEAAVQYQGTGEVVGGS